MDIASVRRSEDPRVTVVVMTRNRREDLLRSLALHRASTIVVDNGSTDGTVEAVRTAFLSVEVVPLGRNAGAAARNTGVRRAATPFVAFADDDSAWAPGALREAAETLASHLDVAAVGARVLVGADERLDPVSEQMRSSPLPPDGGPGRRVLGFVACATMVRRSAFLGAGGFDDVVGFPGEEDRLAWDLAASGWRLVYRDDLVVHHWPSPSRQGPGARRAAVARSALLTAVLRLPWRRVAATLRESVADVDGRVGARRALRSLPAALRARRRLPDRVLADLALLHARAAHDGPAGRVVHRVPA